MEADVNLVELRRTARRLRLAGLLSALVAVGLLLVAAVAPLPTELEHTAAKSRRSIQPLPTLELNLGPLMAAVASRTLIRPSQVQAAVKNTGVAAELLKQIKLQGVMTMGDDVVAYIQVKDRGVKPVREHEEIGGLVVDHIDPSGRVQLSLDGVVVQLTH